MFCLFFLPCPSRFGLWMAGVCSHLNELWSLWHLLQWNQCLFLGWLEDWYFTWLLNSWQCIGALWFLFFSPAFSLARTKQKRTVGWYLGYCLGMLVLGCIHSSEQTWHPSAWKGAGSNQFLEENKLVATFCWLGSINQSFLGSLRVFFFKIFYQGSAGVLLLYVFVVQNLWSYFLISQEEFSSCTGFLGISVTSLLPGVAVPSGCAFACRLEELFPQK